MFSPKHQEALDLLERVRKEADAKQHEPTEAERALEHLRENGCECWHENVSCEWQVRCDEPNCTAAVTCGTPTPDGYRRTCSKHQPGRLAVRKRT